MFRLFLRPLLLPSLFSPSRKKVTQRLSLKGLQSGQKAPSDPNKIQLPGVASAPVSATPPIHVDGTVDIPFSVVLMSIPEQLLTSDHASLMAAPESKVQIGLPLANVLSMLPSGKLEFSLAELSQAIPSGFVQPLENIPEYENTPIVLPLGQVVSRIPAHLLTLRSDQRPIDSSVSEHAGSFFQGSFGKSSGGGCGQSC